VLIRPTRIGLFYITKIWPIQGVLLNLTAPRKPLNRVRAAILLATIGHRTLPALPQQMPPCLMSRGPIGVVHLVLLTVE